MSRLDLITDWIDLARRADYNATELAKLCDVSPSQLRRYFLKVFYRPPQDWINELRLWDAMQMLSSGHPVKRVAITLGFSNAAHFSHRYKAYHGESPARHLRVWARLRHKSSWISPFIDPQKPWVYAERCLLSPLQRKNPDRLN